MNKIQQFEPITHIQTKPTEVLAMLEKGPVILAQRSRPAAVLVSVEEWDRIVDTLAERRFTQREVEAILKSYRQQAAGEPTISHEELKAMIVERTHAANPV